MPTFSYRALQADGKMAQGALEAAGRPDALRQMETLGLRPVNLVEQAAVAAKSGSGLPAGMEKLGNISFKFQSRKVSAKALENFTRLLSSLLAAGVPLSRALVILYKEATSPLVSAKWKQIHDLVVDGMSLANAMAKSPDVFPRVYVAMVEAGEAGGFLDVVLAQIADFQAREKELKSKVLTAMIYPCILLCLALVVLTVLLVFFIPKFQKVFASVHGALPLITQLIIGVSHAVRSYGLFIALGLFGLVFLVRTWFASEKGRRVRERLVLRSPLVGPLVAQFAMARFCRMLGTLLGAGVPLVQGLNVARKSIGNQTLVDAVSESIQRVQQGGRLGQSLAECKDLFAGSILEMISVAEESGKLDSELVRIASVTEVDLDRHLKTAVAFAEPLMLFLIAGFIGIIFIGMLLPVFSLQDYIK
ncbi:MAG TPA: type II secretion system F family protein [Verrucomicrobiae bacterium]|nr:type II secretion system F family protein [Verrucomicrobiae bacterium]